MVGLAFAVAASANFPALLLALTWRRFNTTGAVTGVLGGLTVSLVLIVLSPPVWPGADGAGSPVELTNPAIISIPAGFLCCWLGTMLSREGATERSYHELHVRSEIGLGAE
jgi:cation/acetate symporter